MANDGVLDVSERRSIVSEALNDGTIDPSELVIAKNALESALREVGDLNFQLDRAEGRVTATRGTAGHAAAVARRDGLQTQLHYARNRAEAMRGIEAVFQGHADPVSRGVGTVGNIFGGIFRGIGDIIRSR